MVCRCWETDPHLATKCQLVPEAEPAKATLEGKALAVVIGALFE